MKPKKAVKQKLQDAYPEYHFGFGKTYKPTEYDRRMSEGLKMPIQMICKSLGASIRVRNKYWRIIPGRIVTTAYTKEDKTVHFEPECKDKRLEEILCEGIELLNS